jgi:hypothetical protein
VWFLEARHDNSGCVGIQSRGRKSFGVNKKSTGEDARSLRTLSDDALRRLFINLSSAEAKLLKKQRRR